MSEDEKIFQHLDEFCRRIEQVIDMTVTLNQFSQYIPRMFLHLISIHFRLITSTVRLPKPKRKDLIEAENVVNRTSRRNNH